jgi:hypothetical protein
MKSMKVLWVLDSEVKWKTSLNCERLAQNASVCLKAEEFSLVSPRFPTFLLTADWLKSTHVVGGGRS